MLTFYQYFIILKKNGKRKQKNFLCGDREGRGNFSLLRGDRDGD